MILSQFSVESFEFVGANFTFFTFVVPPFRIFFTHMIKPDAKEATSLTRASIASTWIKSAIWSQIQNIIMVF